jgi:hypothetical protein
MEGGAKRKKIELLIAIALPFAAFLHTLIEKFSKPEALAGAGSYFLTITPQESTRLFWLTVFDIFYVVGIIAFLVSAKNKKYIFLSIAPLILAWLFLAGFILNEAKLPGSELNNIGAILRNIKSGRNGMGDDAQRSANVELLKDIAPADQVQIKKFLEEHRSIDYNRYPQSDDLETLNKQFEALFLSMRDAKEEYLKVLSNYQAELYVVFDYVKNLRDVIQTNDQGKVEISVDTLGRQEKILQTALTEDRNKS